MRLSVRRASRAAAPLRVLVRRFAYLTIFSLATAILVFSRAEPVAVETVRMRFVDVAAPVLEAAARPVEAIRSASTTVADVFRLFGENARLREENGRLRRWQAVARTLERENLAYRELLNAEMGPKTYVVTARMIADSGGAYVRSGILSAGARHGVEVGQGAMTSRGLIGRIVAVGSRSSRLLLLTDLNSRIPVMIEDSRQRAILAGNNTDYPTLDFLPINAKAELGARIVTSGHGGLLPPGIPVGVVSRVDAGIVEVTPFTDWSRLEDIEILDYRLPVDVPGPGAAGAPSPAASEDMEPE